VQDWPRGRAVSGCLLWPLSPADRKSPRASAFGAVHLGPGLLRRRSAGRPGVPLRSARRPALPKGFGLARSELGSDGVHQALGWPPRPMEQESSVREHESHQALSKTDLAINENRPPAQDYWTTAKLYTADEGTFDGRSSTGASGGSSGWIDVRSAWALHRFGDLTCSTRTSGA